MRIRIEAGELPGAYWGQVGVQRSREVVDAVSAGELTARWDLDAELITRADGLDLRGPYVHGNRGERFLYLSWGREEAGVVVRYRRAKLMLGVVDDSILRRAERPGHALVGRLGLTGPDGEPRCAAVRPPAISWSAEVLAAP